MLTEEQKRLLSSVLKQVWSEDVYSIIVIDDLTVFLLITDYGIEWMGRSSSFLSSLFKPGDNIVYCLAAIHSLK